MKTINSADFLSSEKINSAIEKLTSTVNANPVNPFFAYPKQKANISWSALNAKAALR